MADAIRVLCVDDNADLALLLQRRIGLEPGMECVGIANDLDRLMDEIAARRPDVLILDLAVLGRDSLEVLGELRARHPHVRPLVYSGFEDNEVIDRARSAGASGYVTKRDDTAVLLHAVRRVAAGEQVFP